MDFFLFFCLIAVGTLHLLHENSLTLASDLWLNCPFLPHPERPLDFGKVFWIGTWVYSTRKLFVSVAKIIYVISAFYGLLWAKFLAIQFKPSVLGYMSCVVHNHSIAFAGSPMHVHVHILNKAFQYNSPQFSSPCVKCVLCYSKQPT